MAKRRSKALAAPVVEWHPQQAVAVHNEAVRRFETETESAELRALAVSYWLGYPMHYRSIVYLSRASGHEADRQAISALDAAHANAMLALVRFGEARGIDCAAIVDAGRICRELLQWRRPVDLQRYYVDAPPMGSVWPDNLGPHRYELPQAMQQAVVAGEAALMRLAARVDIEEARVKLAAITPKVATGKTKAALILAALCKHHGYDGMSINDADPIGVNELGTSAKAAGSTATRWFKKNFTDGYDGYLSHCRQKRLLADLKGLCGDFTPKAIDIAARQRREEKAEEKEDDCE